MSHAKLLFNNCFMLNSWLYYLRTEFLTVEGIELKLNFWDKYKSVTLMDDPPLVKNRKTVSFVCKRLPFFVCKNLEDFWCEDKEPDSHNTKEAWFESVITLMTILQKRKSFINITIQKRTNMMNIEVYNREKKNIRNIVIYEYSQLDLFRAVFRLL